MKIATDTNCFYQVYTDFETIDILAEAGFDAIDYTFMDERYYSGEFSESERRAYFETLKEYAHGKGICFNQAHAPCPSSTANEEDTEKRFHNIVRSMQNAAWLGAGQIIVHPINHIEYHNPADVEKAFELNMVFYNRLKPYCEEYQIRVALENLTDFRNTIMGHRFFPTTCSSPEEFIRYMDALDSEWFIACLDIGHATVVHQSPADFIRKLGQNRLKALHVHESDGNRDSHTLPFLCGVPDWAEITAALHEIGYRGDLNFEAGNFLKPLPKELYPAGARMMAETGRYLVKMISREV